MGDWACDIGDGPRVYGEREQVARREHVCVECRAPILYSGLWDGSWSDGRQHLLCRDACVWIRDELEGECITFGGLSEWWEDHRSWMELPDAQMTRRVRDGANWSVGPEEEASWRIRARWRRGARMFAMVRRRERLALEVSRG